MDRTPERYDWITSFRCDSRMPGRVSFWWNSVASGIINGGPSTPGYPRLLVDDAKGISVGGRDQKAVEIVRSTSNHMPGGWFSGSMVQLQESGSSSYTTERAKLKKITEGLSKTIMLVEQAGLPQRYDSSQRPVAWNGRASPTLFAWPFFDHSPIDLWEKLPRKAINGINLLSIYGFHPDCAVAANFDGSVMSLPEETDVPILWNKLIRNDGG